MTWARPGMRCVCISTNWLTLSGYLGLPEGGHPAQVKKGDKLIIASVNTFEPFGQFLTFMGVDPECGYHVKFFAPLVDRSEAEDVAKVKGMLTGVDPIERALMLLDEFELP